MPISAQQGRAAPKGTKRQTTFLYTSFDDHVCSLLDCMCFKLLGWTEPAKIKGLNLCHLNTNLEQSFLEPNAQYLLSLLSTLCFLPAEHFSCTLPAGGEA